MKPKNGEMKKQAHGEMKELFGFVPEFYDAMPEAIRASSWNVQRDLELSDTSLDHKTKELIGLAVAAHIKCRYCIHFHTEAARAFGANANELREAVAMGGMTVLFSNSITGAQVDIDEFKKEVDRALEHMTSKKASRSASATA